MSPTGGGSCWLWCREAGKPLRTEACLVEAWHKEWAFEGFTSLWLQPVFSASCLEPCEEEATASQSRHHRQNLPAIMTWKFWTIGQNKLFLTQVCRVRHVVTVRRKVLTDAHATLIIKWQYEACYFFTRLPGNQELRMINKRAGIANKAQINSLVNLLDLESFIGRVSAWLFDWWDSHT